MKRTRYTIYQSQSAGRWSRRLFGGAAALALILLFGGIPTSVRVPITALLLVAGVTACYRIGRWMAGCTDDRRSAGMHLIGASVVLAGLLAFTPVLYRPLVVMAPVVTVLLLDGGMAAAARLRPTAVPGRGTWLGIVLALGTVVAVVAVPRIAARGGGLTYPTPASASLAFAGVTAYRAAPVKAGRAVRISVAYTPLASGAVRPRVTFGGRPVSPLTTTWTGGTLLLTYRVSATGASCLIPFVATAPPGNPGSQFAADSSRAPLRISLWVGSPHSTVACPGAGQAG